MYTSRIVANMYVVVPYGLARSLSHIFPLVTQQNISWILLWKSSPFDLHLFAGENRRNECNWLLLNVPLIASLKCTCIMKYLNLVFVPTSNETSENKSFLVFNLVWFFFLSLTWFTYSIHYFPFTLCHSNFIFTKHSLKFGYILYEEFLFLVSYVHKKKK